MNTTVGAGVQAPGYRLPPASHPGRVRLQVSDIERSLDYYEKVLGMRAIHRAGLRADLTPQGDDRVLVELHGRPGAKPVPPHGRLGLYHYAILLPDRASLGRFLAHLAELGARPGMADHAVSEAIYLSDPDGLGIEVYADRPRSAWQYRGAELAMTTVPLDVSAVIEAGGGERWTGMPARTVMGHVHLHVGDLRGAEEFYHRALGLDKTHWSYPQALFMSAGGYHHHLGTNTWARGARPAGEDDARLIEWELLVPGAEDAEEAGRSLRGAGYEVEEVEGGIRAGDPWGTRVVVRSERG